MKEREKITLIKQCCAICGPLSREEIESISERGEIPKGVVKRMALYRVVQQPDFPDLRKMYMKEGTARQLSETIMKRRAARTSMYATAIPVKERVMSAARYRRIPALLRTEQSERSFARLTVHGARALLGCGVGNPMDGGRVRTAGRRA